MVEENSETIIGESNQIIEYKDEYDEMSLNTESKSYNSINDFIDLSYMKWIFLSGKGGVGKTTCSCSIGIKYSQKFLPDKKVLIISTDPAHNLSDAFNQQFNSEPILVDGFENLYCLEYDTKKGMEKAQEEFMNKMKNNMNQFNQFGDCGDFMKNMPGIDESLGFLYLIKKIKEYDYDLIIFDTAPTGHTYKLLSYPNTLKKSYNNMLSKPLGQMFKMFMANSVNNGEDKITKMINRIEDLNNKLCDPNHSTFICVGIPEFLSVYENERFIHNLFNLNINCSGIIINQIIDSKHCTNDFWKKRHTMQTKYIEVLDNLYSEDFFISYTLLQDNEIRGKKNLEAFTEKLFTKNIMTGPTTI
jgi:arsenite-transporting ATPase